MEYQLKSGRVITLTQEEEEELEALIRELRYNAALQRNRPGFLDQTEVKG
jgi:hypothetical protein